MLYGVCLRYLLNLRRINFLTLRHYRSFLANGTQAYILRMCFDNCLLGPMLKSPMLGQVRRFKICHSLRNDARDLSVEDIKNVMKTRRKFKKNDIKVIVTNENGCKSSMYLSEAEKYADHNNLSLVKLDNSNYRFEKAKYIVSKKTQKDNLKKIIMRDSIADHDLQIKINHMLKFVEKYGVLCVIENVKNKLDDISSRIKNSELKEFVVGENKSSKRIIITLKKKDDTTQTIKKAKEN